LQRLRNQLRTIIHPLSVARRESTRVGHGGAVLLHCFSCQAPAADIAATLGMRIADLFDNPAPNAPHRRPRRPSTGTTATTLTPLPPRITARHQACEHDWRRVRVYTYTTADGRPVQQVIRQECTCSGTPHKHFQQRYRHGRQWVYRKPDDFTPVLYRAATIRTATRTGAWVWITEGEKDADTLTGLGLTATTNAQGAGRFSAELLTHFQGVKVAVVADRDLAGYQRAKTLYQRLHGVADRVVILLAALETHKADVTDHVDHGLWRAEEPFGGLVEVSIVELHALALGATACQAGDRFDIAIAEAQAHHALPGSSVLAAARWLSEAAHQRRAVRRAHHELHRHSAQHPSAAAAAALRATATLRAGIEHTYRRTTTPAHHTAGAGVRLKEPA
jgi:hypothetical protein